MELTYEFIDNNIVPFLVTQKLMLSIIIATLCFIFLQLTKPNKTIDFDDDFEEQSLEEIRDTIEEYSDQSDEHKVFQSILLPKKGDYVEIKEGRWQGYVARITSIVCNYHHQNFFNMKVHKRDNLNFGNDIPTYLLRNKKRDFFKVLTDLELDEYDILSQGETMNRFLLKNY